MRTPDLKNLSLLSILKETLSLSGWGWTKLIGFAIPPFLIYLLSTYFGYSEETSKTITGFASPPVILVIILIVILVRQNRNLIRELKTVHESLSSLPKLLITFDSLRDVESTKSSTKFRLTINVDGNNSVINDVCVRFVSVRYNNRRIDESLTWLDKRISNSPLPLTQTPDSCSFTLHRGAVPVQVDILKVFTLTNKPVTVRFCSMNPDVRQSEFNGGEYVICVRATGNDAECCEKEFLLRATKENIDLTEMSIDVASTARQD